MSQGRKFRAAAARRAPLQIPGAINAYCALLAERAGFKAPPREHMINDEHPKRLVVKPKREYRILGDAKLANESRWHTLLGAAGAQFYTLPARKCGGESIVFARTVNHHVGQLLLDWCRCQFASAK